MSAGRLVARWIWRRVARGKRVAVKARLRPGSTAFKKSMASKPKSMATRRAVKKVKTRKKLPPPNSLVIQSQTSRDSIIQVLKKAGIKPKQTYSQSYSDKLGPSPSSYYNFNHRGKRHEIRLSNHDYGQRSGLDLRFSESASRSQIEILRLVGEKPTKALTRQAVREEKILADFAANKAAKTKRIRDAKKRQEKAAKRKKRLAFRDGLKSRMKKRLEGHSDEISRLTEKEKSKYMALHEELSKLHPSVAMKNKLFGGKRKDAMKEQIEILKKAQTR